MVEIFEALGSETWGDLRAGRRRQDDPQHKTPDPAPTRAVIVTGGSQGLGPALARTFAKAGDTIVIIARDSDLLESMARQLAGELGKPVLPFAIDLTEDGADSRLAAFLADHNLVVEVLINNAGVGYGGAALDQSVDDIEYMVRLNVLAMIRLTHRFLPGMLDRGRGGIVNVSSLGGYVPGPFEAHYYATKAYQTSFTTSLAEEVAGRGVRVMVLAPGPVDTTFHNKMGSENAYYRYLLPSKQPETIARSAWRGYTLGQRVVVTGLLNRIFAVVANFLPHAVLAPLMAFLLKPPERQ